LLHCTAINCCAATKIVASCNNQERFVRSCTSKSEANGHFLNFVQNNVRKAQWRSRALDLQSSHFLKKTHIASASDASDRRKLCSNTDSIDRFFASFLEKPEKDLYIAAQRAAVAHGFDSDPTLSEDGTYLTIESGGELSGCGGRSQRETFSGGDQFEGRNRRLRAAYEGAVRDEGFRALELTGMLPAGPFDGARDFVQTAEIHLELGPERGAREPRMSLPFVAMRKELHEAARGPATVHKSSGGGRD
jgi:hypothetical protein